MGGWRKSLVFILLLFEIVNYASATVEHGSPDNLRLVFNRHVASIPCIAAVIGFAAWNGKPKNFDRHSYVLGFVATMLVSFIILGFATNMHADIRTWQYALEIACFTLGAITFGVPLA